MFIGQEIRGKALETQPTMSHRRLTGGEIFGLVGMFDPKSQIQTI